MDDILRTAEVATVFEPGTVTFRLMTGHEELGRPFVYHLQLISPIDDLDCSQMLGTPMLVSIGLGEDKRHYHGLVAEFGRSGTEGTFTAYHATLRPWLWFLSRTSDCRFFPRTTVPELLAQVFNEHGFEDFENLLTRDYVTREYVVQYRESALNFVCRLMEQEGIYFFFTHDETKHTLVLADDLSAHKEVPGFEEIQFLPNTTDDDATVGHVRTWQTRHEIETGAYILQDFDFENPSANLEAPRVAPLPISMGRAQVFDYPGEYVKVADGEVYARIRLEELHAQHRVAEAISNAQGLGAGALFTLADHPREDNNREHLIVAAEYHIDSADFESGGSAREQFRSKLKAIPSDVPYRPQRTTPRPVIAGPQTATVIGEKEDDEIFTDQYGRVKVQFHWDRDAPSTDAACFVRVAQIWAGPRFGAIHIPRVGQEVIVEFLEGDPDRPIITGRVYNAENMPPFDLPAEKTKSGIKSRSTKGGTENNFNELSFDDEKGKESVFFHAERNMTIKVKRSKSISAASRSASIGGSDSVTVGKGRTLKAKTQTETIEEKHTLDVSSGDIEVKAKARSTTVETSDELGAKTVTVTGSEKAVIKSETATITVEGDKITIEGTTVEVKGDKLSVKGKEVTISGPTAVKINS